ncbi:hypothetical protein [Streptomyces sp. NPDC093568]|uniref:hypothetical protein n=1 Tax=Streptomyces sp. NPDC093568 TaxID=3366041 RepID=UPI00382D72C7
MGEIATASADTPAGPRDAVGHWHVFAKAVADVLGSGPSVSRSTVLHALDACHRELNKVQPHHPPYERDPAETAARVAQASIALSLTIRAGHAADEPERERGTEVERTTATRPERDPEPETEPDSPTEPEPVLTTAGEPEAAAPEPDPMDQLAQRLGELCAELGKKHTRHLRGWRHARPRARFGAAEPPEPAVAWKALHLALLRLPDADCRVWREEAAKAAQECLGGPLPAHEDPAVIVPALRGPEARSGPDGPDFIAREVAVPLDLSDVEALKKAAAGAPSDVLDAVGVVDVDALELGDLRLLWAARAGQALHLAGIDPELQAVIHPQSDRVVLADRRHQSTYRIALLTHLKGAAEAHREKHEDRSQLRSAHKLDGVLGGLLHWPTAAPGSWWWQWRREVSLILEPLARAVDHEVVFDQTSEWQKAELENCTTIKSGLGGEQGLDERLVQWVFLTPLRRIGVAEPQTDFPGRVVRRPDPAGT